MERKYIEIIVGADGASAIVFHVDVPLLTDRRADQVRGGGMQGMHTGIAIPRIGTIMRRIELIRKSHDLHQLPQ